MKKFLLSIFILSIVCFTFIFGFNTQTLLDIKFNNYVKSIETYLNYSPTSLNQDNVINVGFCYIAKVNKNEAKSLIKESNTCLGLSIELEATQKDIFHIFRKLNFRQTQVQNLPDGTIVYMGTSSKFKPNIKTISNVQIAVKNNTIKIGSPMIIGSF